MREVKKKVLVIMLALLLASIPASALEIVETTRITEDEKLDRNPCLIQDCDERFFCSYCSRDRSTKVYNIRISFSSDGIVWSTPRQITTETNPLFGALSPSAIQDQNEIFWLTWHRDTSGIWISKSSNGVDWDTPQQITYYDSERHSWCRHPSLIQDQNGLYWIAYESEIHKSDILIRSSSDGVNWNPPIYVTPADDAYSDGSPSLTQDLSGKYWMAWVRAQTYSLWISSSNDGLSWTSPKEISTGMTSLFPSLIQDLNGKYVLTWTDTGTRDGNIWISSSDDGITWETHQQLTTDARNSFPSLMQDADGAYRVVYTSYISGDDDIWMMKLSTLLIASTIDINPDTLNLKSKGKWITAYIELPEGYDVNGIDVSTVRLDGTIPAELRPTGIGDYDNDGIADLMVKFSRQDLIEILSVGQATLTITGEVDGTSFEGSDTIRVIGK